MPTSLYELSVPTFLQTVRSIGGFLDRAATYFAAKGVDPDDVVNTRLFDDMAPFHFQIEAASHQSVWGVEAGSPTRDSYSLTSKYRSPITRPDDRTGGRLMYLTRFRFNTARTGARRLLTSPQVLHAAVMQSFANVPALADGTSPRVLWRLDRNASNQVLLYIVSPDKPDLTHIVEQAGWPTTGSWETFAYAPFLDKLKAGDVWTFRLTANPVHSIRTKEGEPTKRTAHITAHHQLGWLIKQQERAGFSICEQPKELPRPTPDDEYQVVVRDRRSLDFGKTGSTRGEKGNVQILTVTYEGRLRIDDVDKVRAVLTAGLGKAKAYGCGLMTLAPAQ